ncbi:MAG: exodeoxyribonuclease VII large subunit, partial [Planctomyces sp.]
ADLVADRRALTPSEAGELVVPDMKELRAGMSQLAGRMERVLRNRIDRARLRLQGLESRALLRRPMTLVDERRQRCDDLADRAVRSVNLRLERLRQQLSSTAAALDALSPLRVLSRGYSLTMRADRSVVSSIADVRPGDRLRTRLQDGVLESTVDAVTKD